MPFRTRLQSVRVNNRAVSLFVPDANRVQQAYHRGKIAFPYWSKLWPAAMALSEFIGEHSHFVQNKTVLELGAGLGLPSLVAARFAHRVLCTDGAPEAVAIVKQSAAHLCLQNIETAVADWNGLTVDKDVDVLLLSDVAYDPDGFAPLGKLIDAYLRNGTTIIMAVPQRLQSKGLMLSLLHNCRQQKEYAVTGCDAYTAVTVMVMRNHGEPVAQRLQTFLQ